MPTSSIIQGNFCDETLLCSAPVKLTLRQQTQSNATIYIYALVHQLANFRFQYNLKKINTGNCTTLDWVRPVTELTIIAPVTVGPVAVGHTCRDPIVGHPIKRPPIASFY
ncbi:unnamed protein product [Anisakis simplex]|uniref:Uncharacterized protein n=1 Tax=Anisakis simplex TaxID=6269 RepID=A0A0M3K0D4_ANISI|nr:unnamed protein product [Anisakis simplex]